MHHCVTLSCKDTPVFCVCISFFVCVCMCINKCTRTHTQAVVCLHLFVCLLNVCVCVCACACACACTSLLCFNVCVYISAFLCEFFCLSEDAHVPRHPQNLSIMYIIYYLTSVLTYWANSGMHDGFCVGDSRKRQTIAQRLPDFVQNHVLVVVLIFCFLHLHLYQQIQEIA